MFVPLEDRGWGENEPRFHVNNRETAAALACLVGLVLSLTFWSAGATVGDEWLAERAQLAALLFGLGLICMALIIVIEYMLFRQSRL